MEPISWIMIGLGLLGTFTGLYQSEQNSADNLYLQKDSQKFNAAQAEEQREWQEEMYLKYNTLSGKIAQAKEAGVNPMLAVTGNAVNPAPTSTTPATSGVGGTGSVSSVAAITQLMDTLSNVKLKKAQTENILSETKNEQQLTMAEVALKNAQSEEAQALANEIGVRTQQAVDSWNKKLDKLDAEINEINARSDLSNQQKEVEKQKKLFYESLASYHKWKSDNAALHYWIETGFKALGSVSDLIGTVKNLKYFFTGEGEPPTFSMPNIEVPENTSFDGKYRPSYRTSQAEDFIEQLEYTIGE